MTRSKKEHDFHENSSEEQETNWSLRYSSVLIGGALGDALGMPVEGWSREQIKQHIGSIQTMEDPIIVCDEVGQKVTTDSHGKIPYISPHLHKGDWTDDTWLAVATAKSIVQKRGLDLQSLIQHSLEIYTEQEHLRPSGSEWGIFGGTTTAAFENLRRGISPDTSGVESRNAGNAPALKMATVGLYMHATGKYEEGLVFAEKVGEMTHKDPRSIVSGMLQAHAIYTLLKGSTKEEFLESMITVAREHEKSEEQGKKVTMLSRLEWINSHMDDPVEEVYQELTPGWSVTKNYPFTLYMFLKYWDSPLEGLIRLVNFGGDCDSTGAMYGALVGAKDGMIYPQGLLDDLKGVEELLILGEEIAKMQS